MRPNQALEYLYTITVIEPTVADERAEEAVNVLRRQLKTLECLVEQIAGEAKLWRNEAIKGGLEDEMDDKDAVAAETDAGTAKQMQKPSWWPQNPYPKSIFPMPEEQYLEVVPDPELRSALSGMLGRRFWDIASEAIWAAMVEAADDERGKNG